MKNVTVSLQTLYERFGKKLENGEIIKSVDGDTEYYDLKTKNGLVCMDGETCTVVNSGDFGYRLLNTEGERDMEFILTEEEYNVGIYE